MGDGTVHVDHAALAAGASAMTEVSTGWSEARTTVSSATADVTAGAGELGGSLLDGLHAFDSSWDAVLDVLDRSCSAAAAAMTLVSSTTGEIDEGLGAP